jgi:hypothetical protein
MLNYKLKKIQTNKMTKYYQKIMNLNNVKMNYKEREGNLNNKQISNNYLSLKIYK